jgi:hypothetical protein
VTGICLASALIVAQAGAASAPEAPARAKAGGVVLDYARGLGAERCPPEQAIQAGVNARLGYDPFSGPPERTVMATMTMQDAEHLQALVALKGPNGAIQGKQLLTSTGPNCDELAAAAELAISIAIDPMILQSTAPPPVPVAAAQVSEVRTAAPTAESANAAKFRVGLGALVSFGSAPATAFGADLIFEARWTKFSLGLEGHADVPASQPVQGGYYQSTLLYLEGVPCIREGVFGACALGALGASEASSQGIPSATQGGAPFVALGGRALIDLPLFKGFFARAQADLLVPLVRTSLVVSLTQQWVMPTLLPSLGLALVAELP